MLRFGSGSGSGSGSGRVSCGTSRLHLSNLFNLLQEQQARRGVKTAKCWLTFCCLVMCSILASSESFCCSTSDPGSGSSGT
eukprot:1184664-Amorphochlora_amoeboformis.AAC.3